MFDDARGIITHKILLSKGSINMELLFYIMYPSTLLYPGIFDRYGVVRGLIYRANTGCWMVGDTNIFLGKCSGILPKPDLFGHFVGIP